jgi:hypothetical protein
MIPTELNRDRKSAPQKEWRRPVLRKLAIEATASSGKGGALNNSDGSGAPKTADAQGQHS